MVQNAFTKSVIFKSLWKWFLDHPDTFELIFDFYTFNYGYDFDLPMFQLWLWHFTLLSCVSRKNTYVPKYYLGSSRFFMLRYIVTSLRFFKIPTTIMSNHMWFSIDFQIIDMGVCWVCDWTNKDLELIFHRVVQFFNYLMRKMKCKPHSFCVLIFLVV